MKQPRAVLGISPIVAVASVQAAVAFYVRHLGFEALFVADDGSYAVAGLHTHSIHFVLAADAEALASTARHTSFRLRIEGLDAYWEQVSATHPPTRTRAPKTEPWGIREFHILDADGALIIVSEVVEVL